jgi:Stress responsive A/B Barrel Domain
MICHLVLYRMKQGTTREDRTRLIDEARRRLPRVPGVTNLKAGRNVASADEGYAVALSMDFKDAAALEAYRIDAGHQQFVKEVAEPLVEEIWRYDFAWE